MFSAPDYHIQRIVKLVNAKVIRARKFCVALETINASASVTAKPLLVALGCTAMGLNVKTNGDFVHMPEPNSKNLAAFADFVKIKKADIGFALDPDGDRLVLVSPIHGVISEEYSLALAVENVLTHIEKGPIVINQSTSRMSEDIAKANKCRAYRSIVGEPNVVTLMRKKNAVIGGEGNGGVIYPRLHYGRDGMMGIALVLDYMARTRKTLDELITAIPRYAIAKDKMTLADFPAAKNILIKLFDGVPHTVTDGVRFAWRDKWLHVRASNTEPIVRLFAESPAMGESEALITCAKKSLTRLIE